MARAKTPRHLLVANPTAQSGKNAARIEKARALLDQAGVPHLFVATAPAGGTVEVVARELTDRRSLTTAIYMGGDGTFAEVAKGIMRAGRADKVRLAMLPTGTANDQGKSFGLSAEPSALTRNVEVIADGSEASLDVGKIRALDAKGKLVREDLFFDSAGWGLSPRILAKRNEDRRLVAKLPVVRELYRDHLVYAGAMARTFLESYIEDDKFDVKGVGDGEKFKLANLTDLVVKGTRIYGGMWAFVPDSLPDDGKFELIPFAGKRDWLSKGLVHLDQSGLTHESLKAVGVEHSRPLKLSAMELWFEPHPGGPALAAQIDGEEFPASPRVTIEVLERALRIVVPRGYATE